MAAAAERLAGTGHRNERVVASAAYLAEHLAEVPAIVIPTIIGRHDGSSRPGLFDSVIQAAWSFCLALRARGLGTTWVTAALQDEATVKQILGIPDHMTEVVLFPVAWTKGTDFGRAPRHPARAITYSTGRYHLRDRARRRAARRAVDAGAVGGGTAGRSYQWSVTVMAATSALPRTPM
jgi:nitroreductase